MLVPARFGGSELSVRAAVAVLHGLGLGGVDNGLAFALGAQLSGVTLSLALEGSALQQHRYLPGLCTGRLIGAHAVTEPSVGSDVYAMRTSARRDGDRYVISGEKAFVTNAPIADVFVVIARTGVAHGFGGLSAFVIERGTPGLTIDRPYQTMGLRTAPIAALRLEECAVPTEQRLGAEGAGSIVFQRAMDWERTLILASVPGALARELERCVEYAHAREAFGRSIGALPPVAQRLADMKVRLELVRSLYATAARDIDLDRPPASELAAIVKLAVSEAWIASCLDAQQVYGAYGYLRDNPIERELRDALASRTYSGTNDVQRSVIARLLTA
jgi:alkylation response protein AidB-like acyl-CoA dehydrogenase